MPSGFSLGKVPWQAQVVVLLAVGALAAGSFHYSYVLGLGDELAARQAQLEVLRNDIRKGQAIDRTLRQFQTQVKDLQGRLEAVKPVPGGGKDVGDLLGRIQALASQSNLQIRGFTPKAVTTGQRTAEWPIVLQLDGTYHNLGRFFDKVSKLPRIINIGELRVKAKERPDSRSTITVECTATTFVLESAPATSAVPGWLADGYAYEPASRRDPFVSLLLRTEPRPTRKHTGGLGGALIDEMRLKGILASRDDHLAMLLGPDNRTYVVRAGERLRDGVVQAIAADGIVFLQEVSDPLSLMKRREIRRSMRSTKDVK